MWPRGNAEQQLVLIDDRLAKVADALREAREFAELANIAICEQRRDELLDERILIVAMIPKQREAD